MMYISMNLVGTDWLGVVPVVGRLRADGLSEGAVVVDAEASPLLTQCHLRVARRPRLVGVVDVEVLGPRACAFLWR